MVKLAQEYRFYIGGYFYLLASTKNTFNRLSSQYLGVKCTIQSYPSAISRIFYGDNMTQEEYQKVRDETQRIIRAFDNSKVVAFEHNFFTQEFLKNKGGKEYIVKTQNFLSNDIEFKHDIPFSSTRYYIYPFSNGYYSLTSQNKIVEALGINSLPYDQYHHCFAEIRPYDSIQIHPCQHEELAKTVVKTMIYHIDDKKLLVAEPLTTAQKNKIIETCGSGRLVIIKDWLVCNKAHLIDELHRMTWLDIFDLMQKTPPESVGEKGGGGILEQGQPDDLISLLIAVRDFHVSRATLKRDIKANAIKSYRPINAAKNAKHLVSKKELKDRYQKK